MARSVILTTDELYKRRARNWELHYQHREQVKMYSQIDAERVCGLISERVPAPVMMVDASIMDGGDTLRAQARLVEYMNFRVDRSIMCVYYWSAARWMEFVHEFQSLPDPIPEPYYMFYDEGADAMRLMPVSTMGNNRPKKYNKIQVQVGYKSGTSRGVVPENRPRAGGGR